MSPVQKVLAAVTAGLVLSAVVVLAGLAYVSGGGSGRVRAAAPTATSTIPTIDEDVEGQRAAGTEETTTTASSTTTTTTTTIPGFLPETTTSSPPTTVLGPVVSSSGAVLASPPSPVTRELADGASCQALADPNASDIRCELFRARGGELIWLSQSHREGVLSASRGRRIYVFRNIGGRQWTTVLEKSDAGGSELREVNVRVADVSGDGSQDAVFGFRYSGSGALALDVVEGPGAVTAHRDAANGSARVSTGQLDVWSSVGSSATHEVIRVVQGVYRVVSTEHVASGDVPPSQL